MDYSLYKLHYIDVSEHKIAFNSYSFYTRSDGYRLSRGGSTISFEPTKLTGIDGTPSSGFTKTFLWFEVLTSHLLALNLATDFEHFKELLNYFEKDLYLADRFKMLRKIEIGHFREQTRRYRELLHVRNQLFHRLRTVKVMYNNTEYFVNDGKELERLVFEDMFMVMTGLSKSLERYTDKIEAYARQHEETHHKDPW